MMAGQRKGEDMKYNNIGDAIAGVMDMTKRGMTSHEYELHIKRIKRYARIVEECEDALTCFNEEEARTDERYGKWEKKLIKYRNKLEAEINLGL